MHIGIRTAALLLCLAGGLAGADAADREESAARLEPFIQQALDGGAPGVQVFVRQGNQTWSGAGGVAHIEEGTALTTGTPMRVGGITLAVIEALVRDLAADQFLDLDQPVSETLPAELLRGLPNADTFTPRHLLEHTAGLRNFTDDDPRFYRSFWEQPGKHWDPQELLGFARGYEAPGAPGVTVGFSNTGFILLGVLAEAATGKPVNVLLAERILEPLDMEATRLEGRPPAEPAPADNYDRLDAEFAEAAALSADLPAVDDRGLRNVSRAYPGYMAWGWTAAGLVSTAEDLGRFMQAFRANRVTAMPGQEAFLAGKLHDGQFGWSGAFWGLSTVMWTSVPRDLTIVVLLNGPPAGIKAVDILTAIVLANPGGTNVWKRR